MRFNDGMATDERSTPQDEARARHERFGRLPARVRPADTDESVDTRNLQDRPASALSPDQVVALTAGG